MIKNTDFPLDLEGSLEYDFYDRWIPIISESLFKMALDLGKQARKIKAWTDLENIITTKGMTKTYLRNLSAVVKPNFYMKNILQFLADCGAGSAGYIITLGFSDFDPNYKYRVYNALKILFKLKLVRKEKVEYATPQITDIWIAPFATQEQIQEAWDYYEADKLRFEQRKAKEHLQKELLKTRSQPKEFKIDYHGVGNDPNKSKKEVKGPLPSDYHSCAFPNCEIPTLEKYCEGHK